MKTILIIDDEEKLRGLLVRIISLEGYNVIEAKDCAAALKKLEKSDIDVVLCDVKLPDGNGIQLTSDLKEQYPLIEIIVLTAYGNIADGVQAIKNGAFDYITKGDDNNKIIPLLLRAVEKADLAKRIAHLENQIGKKYSFDTILGKSRPIIQAIELAKKVAVTDTTVLLTGETGTGKEVFAQAIHLESTRSKQNIVAINCSAFGKDLLESEMFGHKAGAFTGALKDQKGLFEEANNGTIFLDEIGEMALDLQAKLLRVIEAGEFIKVGDTKPTKVNVRIIAATNRNLLDEIKAGQFRQDLFYRIAAFQIELPALRDRLSDIPVLANYFLKIFAFKTNKKIKGIADESIEVLKKHAWNGNIRELKNVIERSVIMSAQDEIKLSDLPLELQQLSMTETYLSKKGQASSFELAHAEMVHIQKVLQYTNGNKTECARLLNIALTTLYRKLDELKIS